MFNRVTKALLIATLFLTGCGTSPLIPTATKASASRPVSSNAGGSYALMPLAQGAPGQSTATRGYSSVTLLGVTDLSEDEIAEDADETYGVQANDNVKGYSGFLRRTESSFALETSKGVFKKKTALYTVQALNNDVATSLQGQENRKVLVKAVAAANDTLVVHSVKRLADIGFLFNWYSKGKIAGEVKDLQGKPIAGVVVRAKSSGGFLLTATTESDGEFALKNVTPGSYTLSFAKEGYLAASSTVQANKRKTTNVAATLVATN